MAECNNQAVENVKSNIASQIAALENEINDMQQTISRLENCNGTEENPHNHSSEIGSLNAQISANEELIRQLTELLKAVTEAKETMEEADRRLRELVEEYQQGKTKRMTLTSAILSVNMECLEEKHKAGMISEEEYQLEFKTLIDKYNVEFEKEKIDRFGLVGAFGVVNKNTIIEACRLSGINYIERDDKAIPVISGEDSAKKYMKMLYGNKGVVDYLKRKDQGFYFYNLEQHTEIPIFDIITIDDTNVGGRTYDKHSGMFDDKTQINVYMLCKEANVDYYLILATALHESSCQKEPADYNGKSTASGTMQILDSTYSAYALKSGQYYDEYSNIRTMAEKMGADYSEKDNLLTNISIAISSYSEWLSNSWAIDNEIQAVNHYGEGSNYNIISKNKKGHNIYSSDHSNWELAPSTLEIVYYRDVIANKVGEKTWGVNKYYDLEGNPII